MSIPCEICNEDIEPEPGFTETKAHDHCMQLTDMLQEALPWCPELIRQRIRLHAIRAKINIDWRQR